MRYRNQALTSSFMDSPASFCAGSHEALLHAAGLPKFGLVLRGCDPPLEDAFEKERDQRSIGVLYRPETERQSHYFQS